MRHYFYTYQYSTGNQTTSKKWFVDCFKMYMIIKILFDISKVNNNTFQATYKTYLANHFYNKSSITKRFQVERFFTAIGLFGKWM